MAVKNFFEATNIFSGKNEKFFCLKIPWLPVSKYHTKEIFADQIYQKRSKHYYINRIRFIIQCIKYEE